MVKQVVVSYKIRSHSMQLHRFVLSRSVLQRRLGSSFSPEAGAPFCWRPRSENIFPLRRAGRGSQLKLGASWGISSREGESSVRAARAEFEMGEAARLPF